LAKTRKYTITAFFFVGMAVQTVSISSNSNRAYKMACSQTPKTGDLNPRLKVDLWISQEWIGPNQGCRQDKVEAEVVDEVIVVKHSI
jgi:hypothetical protein